VCKGLFSGNVGSFEYVASESVPVMEYVTPMNESCDTWE